MTDSIEEHSFSSNDLITINLTGHGMGIFSDDDPKYVNKYKSQNIKLTLDKLLVNQRIYIVGVKILISFFITNRCIPRLSHHEVNNMR